MRTDIKNIGLEGVNVTIELVLEKMGFDVPTTRKGSNTWVMKYGSVTLCISYHEHSGFIIGDVYLCLKPECENNLTDFYTYLLRQNDILQGCTLAVNDKNILLSLLIYDQSIHVETMLKLFRRLLETSDKLDNILVENYNAKWPD